MVYCSMGCAGSVSVSEGTSTTNGKQSPCFVTDTQIQIIRSSWTLLSDDMTAHGVKVFRRIFDIKPNLKQLFSFRNEEDDNLINDSRFKGHASRFMQSIGAAVDNLERLDTSLAPVLIKLGRQHIGFLGQEEENFEVFTEAMLHVWSAELGNDFTDQVRETWKLVFDYIMLKLKDGYKQGLSEAHS